MSEEKVQEAQNAAPTPAPTETPATPASQESGASEKAAETSAAPRRIIRRPRTGGKPGEKRNFRGRGKGGRRERPKPEYDQKIVSLRRVTRVMAGGRRFSFSVAMVIGDKRGRVGFGVAKANDTSLAIQKAFNDAKRNLVLLKLDEGFSIPHESDAKFNSARVTLRPNGGRGLVAGSSMRTVLEYAGIKNVTSRVLSRSRNKINNARATFKALEPFVAARGQAAQKKPKPQSRDNQERPRRRPRTDRPARTS